MQAHIFSALNMSKYQTDTFHLPFVVKDNSIYNHNSKHCIMGQAYLTDLGWPFKVKVFFDLAWKKMTLTFDTHRSNKGLSKMQSLKLRLLIELSHNVCMEIVGSYPFLPNQKSRFCWILINFQHSTVKIHIISLLLPIDKYNSLLW